MKENYFVNDDNTSGYTEEQLNEINNRFSDWYDVQDDGVVNPDICQCRLERIITDFDTEQSKMDDPGVPADPQDDSKNTDTIRNINEIFGDAIQFDSVDEMANRIQDSGYNLPDDGLVEGRDYIAIKADQN